MPLPYPDAHVMVGPRSTQILRFRGRRFVPLLRTCLHCRESVTVPMNVFLSLVELRSRVCKPLRCVCSTCLPLFCADPEELHHRRWASLVPFELKSEASVP
ncbi:hypothetical protein Pan44_26390 [Caulifigura coniformis]|uniref:Uncharacterized protein n=1 Tax=Caulifigura coniformis TaxID=2527983 RepID=A0A517SEQ5_9PLAN|nr:hypothetical protein Pan44_26390 [Caulifigura coniformis]